jgi:hypothetical protein
MMNILMLSSSNCIDGRNSIGNSTLFLCHFNIRRRASRNHITVLAGMTNFRTMGGLTIKFANSPRCACRGSNGEKPQYGLMTLAYQRFTVMLLLIYDSLFLSGVYYCLSVFGVMHHDNALAYMAISVREF